MNDIIEQCALASINSHRAKGLFGPLENLDDMPNADEWRTDARAVLAKFKELTAEPTPAMIEAMQMAVINGRDIQTAATEQMWKDIL